MLIPSHRQLSKSIFYVLYFQRQPHNGKVKDFLDFFYFLVGLFFGQKYWSRRFIPNTWPKVWAILWLKIFWASKILLEFFRIFLDFFLAILKTNIIFHTPSHTKGVWKNAQSHNHLAKFCVWSDPGFFLRMSLYWDT